ncbi:MAG: glycoside hydrolase family 1 protein [Acidimicrobiales bacterium]
MPDFPPGFLWGTATSAHQIEGGNFNSDWWAWEHDPASGCVAPSGDACDSFHRWREDVDLVAMLGLGAYRFSLEWARIEPAEGEWSLAALDHYRRLCAACRARGIQPVVTFHHFTLPRWLSARGGWEAADAPERFAGYVERAVAHLGDLVGWACTVNEPNVVALMGYRLGVFPPGIRGDADRHRAVNERTVRAHRLAVEALRAGPGRFPVGLTLSMAELVAEEGGEEARDEARELLEDSFLRATGGDDFVGVQCYTRLRFGPGGRLLPPGDGVPVTQMGYEHWPQVAEHTVRRAAAVSGLPVLVTENGIGTDDDRQRVAYLAEALAGVARCLADGIDVRGYFAWSLLDNFEWSLGYGPRFGLVGVDRTTFERRPKPSAFWLANVAAAGRLDEPPSGRSKG